MLSKTVFDGVGKMVCGLAGRGIAQEYPPRPKTEPRSVRGVRGGGWGWMGIAWFLWLIVRGRVTKCTAEVGSCASRDR